MAPVIRVGGNERGGGADRGKAPRIIVVGGGFAGVWSALSAARVVAELADPHVSIILVSADPFLTIRPRLYEPDLKSLRLPLDRLLRPAGVERMEARVTAVDPAAHTVTVVEGAEAQQLRYDRLVLAAGSHLARPPVPGLAEHAFDVDTYRSAQRLQDHLQSLPQRSGDPARFSAVVIGAGFTGLEVATELVGRLEAVAGGQGVGVTLVESSAEVGPDLGPGPRPAILAALGRLGIRLRLGVPAVAVDAGGVTLAGGERLPATTTVWAGGLRASPLAADLRAGTDGLGRVPVDAWLRAATGDVFAAGDVARAMADADHPAPMSCQHAIPMGKFAGHNAAADLLGLPLLSYDQADYVTCLDLGAAGAVFTRGWDRHVLYTGATAKRLKEQINRRDIVPPLTGRRRDLFDAARPESPAMDGLVAFGAQIMGTALARR
jgi:NADH dehydrogenase